MPFANKLKEKLYHCHYNFKARCYNSNDRNYNAYGARGVTVSNEWLDFNNFYNDAFLLEGFDANLILLGKLCLDKDSKDITNKIYCKEKCIFLDATLNRQILPSKQKLFKGINASGEIFLSYNQREFSRQHNLQQKCIFECLKGNQVKTKGWSFVYVVEGSSAIERAV